MSIVSNARRSINSPSGSKGKVVRFQLNYNLKSLLLDFVTEKDRKLFEDLVCHIRDIGQEIRDDELSQLLKEVRGCISILDGNLTLFVQVVLILKWTHRSDEVVSEYQGFLLDLCSAHNYYTKLVVDHLVASFKSDETTEWEDGIPSAEEIKCIGHIHHVIKSILRVIPMSQSLLMSCIMNKYPYLKRPTHEHETYLYNILQLISYEPILRGEILKFIITKLIALDVHTPRSELEHTDKRMEVEGKEDCIFAMDGTDSMIHPLGHTLDVCLNLLFSFLHDQCHDESGALLWDKTKSLYSDILKVFENVILPTHAIHHTQFIVFYFVGFKPILSFNFLQMLWHKVTNPSIAPVLRQSSVWYIASLLCRGNYISILSLKDVLIEMTNWIHSYIDCQDGSSVTPDSRVHGVFYATCQALFYVIAFRYKELIIDNRGLTFLQGLNLSKIVTCRLNPLRVCQPAIVSRFASIARAYQLAYCYTIIERNSRSTLPQVHMDATGAVTSVSQIYLDSFFPFDPYLLDKSNKYIEPLYREYSDHSECLGTLEPVNSELTNKEEDIDDFLESPPVHDTALSNFSYGTSPGFLQN